MKATLTEAEFDRLVRLAQTVDLIAAQSKIDIATATARRNEFYATLAAKYKLPTVNVAMGWDEASLTIDVAEAPAPEKKP